MLFISALTECCGDCWNLNKKLTELLDELLTWYYANGLVISTKKSTAMLFHTWLKESSLTINQV
jgi:hypothetical protein